MYKVSLEHFVSGNKETPKDFGGCVEKIQEPS